MAQGTKKTTKRKRTTLKELPAKVKDMTKKNAKRISGGARPGFTITARRTISD